MIVELYAMMYHEKPIELLSIVIIQAIILSFIAWAGFKLGAKRYCKAYERKAVILGGLYVWCMAYVAFKFLRLFPGIEIVAVASPFLIVAALSFLAGKQGGFGRRYANERQS
ncbi:MAG: hypothetical protein ABW088_16850 [Sedimenticola sp.]